MENEEITGSSAEPTEPLPEMRPWFEVGWIFRHGDAHAIERQGDRMSRRTAPVRDE